MMNYLKSHPVLAYSLLYLLLILSWCIPPLRAFTWQPLDEALFLFINQTLETRSLWTQFWAFFNQDLLDRAMELMVFLPTFWYIYKDKEAGPKKRFQHFLAYYLLFTVVSILLKYLLHSIFNWHRLSPTGYFPEAFRLSKISGMHVKDFSRNSFPADHALFLFLMTKYHFKEFKGWIKPWSLLVTLLFTFTRLVSGGHWPTDVIIGGFLPASLFALWTLDTKFLRPLLQEK